MANLSTSKVPSPFEVLGVEPVFDLDPEALEAAYLAHQLAHHPDRFVHDKPAQLKAERTFSQIVWAYQDLKNPRKRAEWIFKLHHQWPLPQYPETLAEMMDIQAALEDGALTPQDIHGCLEEARAHLSTFLTSRDWAQAGACFTRWTALLRLETLC